MRQTEIPSITHSDDYDLQWNQPLGLPSLNDASLLQKPLAELLPKLEELGFERGWGKDRARIQETMRLLLDILEVSSLAVSSSGYPLGAKR